MKKVIPLLTFTFIACISQLAIGQPCIPNNDTTSGIEPDTLAIAYVGVPYEQVIYFRLPADTLVDFVIGTDTITILVCIDSLTIDSVHGLPDGFTIGCNVPWCAVKGGGNGCASITGTATPDQAGIHPLDVFVTIYVNDCFSFALPAMVDTVSFYFLDIQFPLGEEEIALPEFSVENLFPNPANDQLVIPMCLSSNSNVEISVMDVTGKVFERKNVQVEAGRQNSLMDVSKLSTGLYFISVKIQDNNFLRKFQVVR